MGKDFNFTDWCETLLTTSGVNVIEPIVEYNQDNSIKNTLVHELQHQIQAGENFARGGDTNMFNRITPPKDVQKQLKKKSQM